jgi:uncharacterized protein (TIGR03382 family)
MVDRGDRGAAWESRRWALMALAAALLALPWATHATCGDGVLDVAEGCDDAGTLSGDGCDRYCQLEPGASCVGQPSACSTPCGDCSTFVQDDFADNTFDAVKWQANSTNTSAAVVEQNGRIELSNRGLLGTTVQLDPAVARGIRVRSRWTIGAGDLAATLTRSNFNTTGGFGSPSTKVLFYASQSAGPNNVAIVSPTDVSLMMGTLAIAAGDKLDCTVTDDGAQVTFRVENLSTGGSIALNAIVTTDHAADYVVFTNREFSAPGFTSFVDDIRISPLDAEGCNSRRCDTSDNTCRHLPSFAGQSCNDGDLCTVTDACSAGACAGASKDCSAFADACNAGACNGADGSCFAEPAHEGATCDDASAETVADVCALGTCAGTVPHEEPPVEKGAGCSCATSYPQSLLLLGAGVVAVRRRRRLAGHG